MKSGISKIKLAYCCRKLPSKQHGAVLIFCLVFLLVLTIMGVASMESTVLEERMAGNMQDYSAAFQAAEAALEVGENWLAGETLWPSTSNDGSTVVWLKDATDPDGTNSIPWWQESNRDSNEWWENNGRAANGFTELAAPPAYIIEEYATSNVGQSIAIGSGTQTRIRVFHRITARGTGGNAGSTVQVQSTFVKPYE